MHLFRYVSSIRACFLLLATLLTFSSAFAQTYCTPSYVYDCQYGDDLNSFSLTGANSTSFNQTNTGCSSAGYANYTGLTPVQMMQGSTYSGTLNSSYFSNEYMRAWIDFNSDGTFSASEEVGTASNFGTTTVPFSLTIPLTAQTGLKRMRVRVAYAASPANTIDPCSSYYYGETHDYSVSILSLPACSGTPTAGSITGPGTICPNIPFTLSLTGATSGGNITYQWQSSPVSPVSWTTIGTSSVSYTSPGISTPTMYRVNVICSSAGGGTSTTSSFPVSVSPALSCYCTPTYTYGCSSADDINTFTLNGANSTSFNQPNTGCSSGGYANYTALTPVQLVQGATYSGTINSNYSSNEWVRIWIDFNDDGQFVSAEEVGTVSNIGTTLAPYSITLPASAATGTHRMRVRLAYATSPANTIDPCTNYTYGETHDYNVTVMIACTGTPSAPLLTTAAQTAPVCVNGTATLTATNSGASAGATYQWEQSTAAAGPFSNATGGSGATTLSYTTPALTATTYYRLKVICGANSAVSSVYEVLVGPQPSGPITGPSAVCANQSYSYTVTPALGATAYAWSLPSGWSGTSTTNTISVTTGSAGGTITVTPSGACGNAAVQSLAVTNNTPPAPAAITGPASVCTGNTVTFASTTTGGTWSSSNTAVATVNASGVVSGAGVGTATITYTVTNSGCTASAAKSISVVAPPAAPAAITGQTTFCINNTSTLSSATSGGTWSSSNPAVASVSSTGLVTANAIGTTIISYAVSNGTCSTAATTTVTITALAQAPLPVNGSNSVCAGASIQLTNGNSGGTWSSSNTGVATVNAAGVVTGVAAGTSVISYTIGTTGCIAVSNKAITVNASPAVPPAISGSSSVCQGASTLYSIAATGGVWSSASPAVASVSPTGLVTGLTGGTSQISYTLTLGTCSTSTSKPVTIIPAVVPPVTGDTIVCVGTSKLLSSSMPGGTWSSSNTGIATVSSNGMITGIGSGTAVITYSVPAACGGITTVPVTVIGAPSTPVISGGLTGCVGNPVQLTASVPGGTWASNSGNVANINPLAGLVLPLSPGTVQISYTVANAGCSVTTPIDFSVVLPPAPVIVTNGNVLSTTTAYASYTWFRNGSVVFGATGQSVTVTSDGNYYVQVLNAQNCSGTSAAVQVKSLGIAGPAGAQAVHIYPNPSSAIVNIVSGTLVDATFSTIDGKAVLRVHNARKVDVSSLADGMYYLRITDDAGKLLKVERFVKASR